jgi:hypothetical protein
MESELEKLRRANAELQAWVRDLLVENRTLRQRLALGTEPGFGEFGPPEPIDGAAPLTRAACPAAAA